MYFVELSSRARKDRKLLKGAGLEKKAKMLLDIIALNPFQSPPPFERLSRELRGNFSRRLNSQHRLVFMTLLQTAKISYRPMAHPMKES